MAEQESSSAAPGELELVRSFVNTLNVETGTDRLGTPDEAATWLADRGHEVTGPVRARDLRLLVGLREAIRDLVTDRGPDGLAAAAEIDRIAARHPLSLRLGSPARVPLAPTGEGIDAFVGHVLAIIAASVIDGRWDRLKACPNDRCRWLFYDHSKNRSRTWCSMDVCGSRAKMQAYRRRRRSGSARG
jgi:predicted RNA-binding Zn ribbon-like protein